MDLSFFVIVALGIGAMWLLSSRTRKQQRAATDFRANLVVGQEVMTGSGLFGTVVEIEDDIITLESTPGTQTRWLRAAIAKLVEPPVEDVDDEDDDVDDDEYVDDEGEGDDESSDTVSLSKGQDEDEFEVPDDLSTLPPERGDGEPEKK
jgi:preprotein translocase subunit YajC